MKINLLFVYLIVIVAVILQSCSKHDVYPVAKAEVSKYSSNVAVDWMKTIRLVVQSEGRNPPQASRIYAYSSIALYESVVSGMPNNNSLEGQIPGLINIPKAQTFGSVDYTTAVNEAIYTVATQLFGSMKPENVALFENLHKNYFEDAQRTFSAEVFKASADYGKAIALAVMNRANNDNYLSTRSLTYAIPSTSVNPMYWSPTGAVTAPLEPYWGQLKCFTMADGGACTIKSTIPFNTAVGSEFYNQADEVRTATLNLNENQKAIANWWSDGASQTATPPGHWVSIVEQLSTRKRYDLGKTAEIFATLNIAMADAFISCWDEKYKMNLLRPVTYIQKYIAGSSTWKPFLSTPAFPEYPSGHSVASAAAGDILTTLIGNVSFTDSTNTYLGYAPRTYSSFNQAATEAAISRLYGGIHFREAVENGLKQGEEVGAVVFKKIKLRK